MQLELFDKYGLPGLVIGALFIFLVYVVREHRAERSEWITTYRETSQQSDIRQSETNLVIRELINVIHQSNNRRRDGDY